jgi:hypothetical protein
MPLGLPVAQMDCRATLAMSESQWFTRCGASVPIRSEKDTNFDHLSRASSNDILQITNVTEIVELTGIELKSELFFNGKDQGDVRDRIPSFHVRSSRGSGRLQTFVFKYRAENFHEPVIYFHLIHFVFPC